MSSCLLILMSYVCTCSDYIPCGKFLHMAKSLVALRLYGIVSQPNSVIHPFKIIASEASSMYKSGHSPKILKYSCFPAAAKQIENE